MPIFCQTTSFLSKTHCYHFIFFFFKFSTRNPPAVMAIFGQKAVNSVKSTLFYGPKKVNRTPFFFHFFTKKSMLSCSQFVMSYLEKNSVLMSIFCPKTSFFQKHSALMSFDQIIHENPLQSLPYFVKKTSFLPKRQDLMVITIYIMGQNSQQNALFSNF